MKCDYCGKKIKPSEPKVPQRHHYRGDVWLHEKCDDLRYTNRGLKPPKRIRLTDFDKKERGKK